MSEVASFLFLVIDEFSCSDLIKVLRPSGAAEVFSQTLVIVLKTMIVLTMMQLLRSELLVLIRIRLIHDLSVRMGEMRTVVDVSNTV